MWLPLDTVATNLMYRWYGEGTIQLYRFKAVTGGTTGETEPDWANPVQEEDGEYYLQDGSVRWQRISAWVPLACRARLRLLSDVENMAFEEGDSMEISFYNSCGNYKILFAPVVDEDLGWVTVATPEVATAEGACTLEE
jgi:hypothetical protein